jgi:hypothetical protein
LTYQIPQSSFGKYLSLRVVATNSLRTVTYFTQTGNKVVSPPRILFEPVVKIGTTTGETRPRVGGVVSTSGGTWTGSTPMTLTTQWLICDEEVTVASGSQPVGCTEIPGATGTPNVRYELPRSAANKYIMVKVTADNGVSVQRWSRTTPLSAASPPVPDTNPTLEGTAEVGETLEGKVGWWTSDPPLEVIEVGNVQEQQGVSRLWYRCNQAVADLTFEDPGCTEITGASSNTYDVQNVDAGKYISFSVVVRNSADQRSQVWTASTAMVAQAPTVSIIQLE